MLDYFRLLIPFLGGGLVGGLLVEWLRRRAARIQVIPLIVRMNRRVRADIAGFTLARVTGPNSPPEVISDLREYQFTLKNISNVHLQDAEIQFEFPSTEVQALAERPVRSNTALMPIECNARPGVSVFRWRIPQLPATDSVDFTFRAINAKSEAFEVSLYKSDRVVVKPSTGEPASVGLGVRRYEIAVAAVLFCVAGTAAIMTSLSVLSPDSNRHTELYTSMDCRIRVSSSMEGLQEHTFLPASGPWRINYEIENLGDKPCSFQSAGSTRTTIEPGRTFDPASVLSADKPRLFETPVLVRKRRHGGGTGDSHVFGRPQH